MKTMLLCMLLGTCLAAARGETIVLQRLQGEVSVRHGVMEEWRDARAGDVLKPDDTIKTGKHGMAVIVARDDEPGGSSAKRIALPAEVMVDMSDIRTLSPEELMLKLTMEKVRASSYQWKSDELHIPNATVVHGADRSGGAALRQDNAQTGIFEWNGARVLFDNGFYSTCALKSQDLFRRFPELKTAFENRWLAAQALEKASLRGEALEEYGAILASGNLSASQETLVRGSMQRLRQ